MATKAIATSLEKQLAARVRETSETVVGDGNNLIRVTTKGFMYQQANIGMSFEAIVLGSVFEKVYFDTPFNADNPTIDPPCWAVGTHLKTLAPPVEFKAASRQADTCAVCPQNEFGTANEGRGRGKACRDYRRVAVVAWADGQPNLDEVAILRLAPTSLGPFNGYLSKLVMEQQRDPIQFVTKFSVDLDSEYPLIRKPEAVHVIDDKELLGRLLQIESSAILMNVGYSMDPKAAGGAPAKKKAAARRGRSKLV